MRTTSKPLLGLTRLAAGLVARSSFYSDVEIQEGKSCLLPGRRKRKFTQKAPESGRRVSQMPRCPSPASFCMEEEVLDSIRGMAEPDVQVDLAGWSQLPAVSAASGY